MKPIVFRAALETKPYAEPVFDGLLGVMTEHPENSDRLTLLEREVGRMGWHIETVCGEINDRDLCTVHDEGLLGFFREAAEDHERTIIPDTFAPGEGQSIPESVTARAGYYCFDTQTPFSRQAWIAARNAAETAHKAAEFLLVPDYSPRHTPVYALVRPPGHHAGYRFFGGFCYLNNAAVAARFLSRQGKVAILDIDYHHGNGTQDIFYTEGDVLYCSIHADPDIRFPYYWGSEREKGADAGSGANLNIPLPEHPEPGAYLSAVREACAVLRKWRPNHLVVSLGVDTAAGDPIGDMGLSPDDFTTIGREIRALNLPTCVIQEGGYSPGNMATAVPAFFDAWTG